MTFHVEADQHIGRRAEQQDAVRTAGRVAGFAPGSALAIVADGMGGMTGGAEAARVAADTFVAAFARGAHAEPASGVLHRALGEAGAAVFQHARAAGVEGGMGTTFVAASFEHDRLFWTTVGDSRLYHVRAGRLAQLNAEHTLGARLMKGVAAGMLTREDALAHPDRHALTSFLGLEKIEEIDGNLEPLRLAEGDRVLLCSDGLHGTLSDDEMAAVLAAHPAAGAAAALVAAVLAKDRPSQDNVTACVVTCGAASARPRPPAAEPAVTVSLTPGLTAPARPGPAVPGAPSGGARPRRLALLGALVLLVGAGLGGAVVWALRDAPAARPSPVDSTALGPALRPDTVAFFAPLDSTRADSIRQDSARLSPSRSDTVAPSALRPPVPPAPAVRPRG